MTEKERVGDNLNALSILYYVWAGFHLFGVCFGGLYVAMGGFVHAAIQSDPKAPPGTEMIGGVVAVIGVVVVLIALTGAICSFLSARWLKQRRNRTFSQIVAGLACLSVPLGTALGVFTFIVLGKPEAQELYREAQGGGPPPV